MKSLGLIFGSLLLAASVQALTVDSLRCDSRDTPLGIDTATPQLSWLPKGQQRGDTVTAYQIQVASSAAALANGGDLWDSGKVLSAENANIAYGGTTLTSCKQVFWKVRVWDASDAASAWSASASWTMGVLNAGDWTANWITPSTAATDVGSSMLRREFTVASGLVRAVVFVSGLGQYEMSLNGNRVGQDLFSPGWTKYDKTVLYDTYDITAQIQAGANAVGIMLGNGMYNVPDNSGRYTKFTGTVGPRKAIAQIRLEYANGTVQTVGTDANWKWANGPVTFNTVYGGEDYDARLEQAGWNVAGFNQSTWAAVSITTGPGGTLRGTSYAAPPLRKQAETFSPTPALVPTAASKVYDFVQNASNVPTLTVYGPAGATVKLSGAEVGSTDGNGSISQINDPSWSLYTLKGSTASAPEVYMPRFVYLGYRYLKVEITGGATIVSLTSTPVHSSVDSAGDFSCSKTLFNDIRRIIRWAQRSNLVSLLTDCPTREKLGWLEQYHLHGPSLRYEFDLTSFFRKTYTDMADSQVSNGLVPNIAPEFTVFGGDFRDSPEWGSSFVLSPEQNYDFYGDTVSTSRHYANIKRYVDYLTSRASGNLVSYGLGDWYDVGPNPPGYAQLTPQMLTATAIYYADARALAGMAQRLGNTADASTYTTLASNIRASFNSQFYNAASGSYSTGSQTANAMPLALGLVDDVNRAKVVIALVAQVRKDGNSVTAGDIGHRYLLRALADAGRSDVIYDIHSKTSKPGYGYILSQGYTALTEGWDGSNSKNHFMLGHIMEWFYHDLVGIGLDATGPAFRKILLRPQIVGDVTWAKATYQSIRGPITSDWSLSSNNLLTYKVSVPVGSTATVYVPTLGTSVSDLSVQESGTTIWQNGTAAGSVSSVTFDHTESGNQLQSASVWKVGSGDYVFTAQLKPVPYGLAAMASDGQAVLTWNAVENATGYVLKRAGTSGGPYTTIANLPGVTFTDTSVTNGVPYYYVVAAQLPTGNSANSFEVSVIPAASGNFGFETPSLSSYQYNPSGASWTFTAQSGSNGSGISANGSGFTSSNGAAPEGSQVAFIQGLASISQSFATTPGVAYGITFSAAQRASYNGNGQTWDLRLDGTAIASYAPGQAATAYSDYTAAFVGTASSHTLAFVGTNTNGGDNTIFLDNIRLATLGTIIGTSGSWNGNAATTSAAAFDGNLNTAFDAAQASGAWVGLDLGVPRRITAVRFAPRPTYQGRMVGGKFQGSNTADFSSGVIDLYTITTAPTSGVITSQTITNATGFRYVRYLSPDNGNCNIAEFAVSSVAVVPAAPTSVSATPGSAQISLSWATVPGATGYSVRAASTAGGPYTLAATGLYATSFSNAGLGDATTRYYVVTATNSAGESTFSGEVSATTYTALMTWRMANFGTTAAVGNAADSADPDGDGMTNAQEYAAGTNPNDPNSNFKVTQIASGQSGWSISFPTVAGKTYRVESSPSLMSGSWTTVQDNIVGTGGSIQVIDPASSSISRRFYRAVILP